MEIIFLIILLITMAGALLLGFPVAFALPGAAILSMGLAALCGYLIADNVDYFFLYDGPIQWLSAGVTNFRSLFWLVERDTLIAIPLFIFMGVILQRSKIAEDLLLSMARLFGPIPGGVGLSVILVGAMLAATTGIVGATVVAMGLISLPSMLKNNYSKPLASGIICASGSLGQIIPPSIVLIILADQLASAADQASALRKSEYQQLTGESTLPAQFDIASASAGDMFIGALIPGLVLVLLYMAYVLFIAIIRPQSAPKTQHEHQSLHTILMALIPPLVLIVTVLGSIIMGVATVNQAGAIGAVGAVIMAGYRVHHGQNKKTYVPLIIALISIIALLLLKSQFNLNIKSETKDIAAIYIALCFTIALTAAILISLKRIYRTDNILIAAMKETTKTTAMVFVILIGAAMLTSAFRAFGGEHIVREFLTSLPGGFWTQFFVVMLIIFLLGFFLDFIEIAVVVVPIVAPILLANPEANITALWLGVMIGLNIQTSFLTPPFGFSLFYLRGVAPTTVKTTDIYKGASVFIVLQLTCLLIAGFNPKLINYLPNRLQLSSENAPPPTNPRLQYCLNNYLFRELQQQKTAIQNQSQQLLQTNWLHIPEDYANDVRAGIEAKKDLFDAIDTIDNAQQQLDALTINYQPIQQKTLPIRRHIIQKQQALTALERARRNAPENAPIIDKDIAQIKAEITQLESDIPANYSQLRQQYITAYEHLTKQQRHYHQSAEDSYAPLQQLVLALNETDQLKFILTELNNSDFSTLTTNEAVEMRIKYFESALRDLALTKSLRSALSKARRQFKKDNDIKAFDSLLTQAKDQIHAQINWRQKIDPDMKQQLIDYELLLRPTLGIRLQARLNDAQTAFVANCRAAHSDISLTF